jgi:hypothetical protein
MNTVEIVHLRSSSEPIEALAERIKESIWMDGSNGETVTVFRRNGLETDIAVHIRHRQPHGGNGPSTLAFNLANALRTFGIVEHTVWEEMP